MKYSIWLILALALLAGCSPPAQEPMQEKTEPETQAEDVAIEPEATQKMPPEGGFDLAPELSNDVWLNTNGEILRLANLRGKVVLLEMWTFG